MMTLHAMARTDATSRFLMLLSSHLSGNSKYRRHEYVIEVRYTTNGSQLIKFDHDNYVFPNTHNRSLSDRTRLIMHVLEDHLSYEYEYSEEDASYTISNNLFTNGTYVYKKSINNKRRWERMF